MPRVMKGLEKSMTFSLSAVMVKAATARSAFCWRGSRWGRGRGRTTGDGQLETLQAPSRELQLRLNTALFPAL